MYKKLDDLSGLSAEQILELCGEISHPVEMETLLNKLSVRYIQKDFSEIERTIPSIVQEKGHILGAIALIDNEVNILYRNDGTVSNKLVQYTLAHELAYCCLNANILENSGHFRFENDDITNNGKVFASDIFASNLLIPKNKLIDLYKSIIAPLADVLANEFNVEPIVMEMRLKYLNLPYYSLND